MSQPLIHSHCECVLQLQRPPEAWVHQAAVARPGKRANAFFTPQGASSLAGTDRGQRSLMVAITRRTVSTTAIRRVWSELPGKMKAEGEKRDWVCIDTFTHMGVQTHLSCKPGGHLGTAGSLDQLLTHFKRPPELIPNQTMVWCQHTCAYFLIFTKSWYYRKLRKIKAVFL